MRRSALVGLLVLLVVSAEAWSPATGAGFPEKPITFIVHASAGGGSDIFARTLTANFEKDKLLPQPVVVENKPGGSGAIAYAYVASKRKDPYFLLTATPSFLTTPILRKSTFGYKDFTPIANFAFDDFFVMVKADSKYHAMKDLIAEARIAAKKVTVGGTQLGGSDSIATYLVEKAANVKFNFIVFNGGGEVNAALMGGHIDVAMTNPGEALELAKANKVRLLGTLAQKRLPSAPDIPTLREQGLDAVFQQHRGVVAPAGISEDARKVLEGAMQRYAKSAAYRKYAEENFLSEGWMDGAAYGKYLDREAVGYPDVLQGMGLLK